MKRRLLLIIVLGLLALLTVVPAVTAEGEIKTEFSGGEWVVPCGGYITPDGRVGGVVRVHVEDRIAPGFYLINSYYSDSVAYGPFNFSERWDYPAFEVFSGSWDNFVPYDGWATNINEVFDSGGGLHSSSAVTADCTTGAIDINQGDIHGPKPPKDFVLRSLSCSSAVLNAPGGGPVGDNSVLAGQAWYVNPTPEVGPDGEDYTEIFVGGFRTGFIPTVCVGGAPA
jgi:hypothetical protein